ncbi:hypothetical protein B0H13DRAFT_401141 [Mycena leptocephala]|nr:hypothetical protein B0H13DRAFT_401141 [Mycena leptocephala]
MAPTFFLYPPLDCGGVYLHVFRGIILFFAGVLKPRTLQKCTECLAFICDIRCFFPSSPTLYFLKMQFQNYFCPQEQEVKIDMLPLVCTLFYVQNPQIRVGCAYLNRLPIWDRSGCLSVLCNAFWWAFPFLRRVLCRVAFLLRSLRLTVHLL